MNDKSSTILIVTDLSYFEYYVLFGAVSQFQKKFPEEASILIKPPEETDQQHLPNLLNSDNFKRILKQYAMKRLETIDWLTKTNFQNEVDIADGIEYVFAVDDDLGHSFRKSDYAEYKAQRIVAPKSFNVYDIKKYIKDVIFKELELEEKHEYHFVKVEGAEGDDVVACVCRNLAKDYMLTVLYASDHDFLQLEGIHQYDLMGRKVEPNLGGEIVTPHEYMLGKILIGDNSDNIPQVFPKVGPKKALKLVKDRESLKKKLSESQDAAKQFLLNKHLISFDEIPEELEQKIVQEASKTLYREDAINKEVDLADFMNM